jgi:hypothetical protein
VLIIACYSVIPYYSITEQLPSFFEHLQFFAEQELHSTRPTKSVDHCYSVIPYNSITEQLPSFADHLLSFTEHWYFLLNKSCTLRGQLEVLIIASVISYNSLTENLIYFAEHKQFFAEQELHSTRPARSVDHCFSVILYYSLT